MVGYYSIRLILECLDENKTGFMLSTGIMYVSLWLSV